MPESPLLLSETFAVLTPGLRLRPVPLAPDLYPSLDRDFDGFRGHLLVSEHTFAGDWPGWECHPAGDELVLLLDGAMSLLLREPDGDRAIELDRPGEYVRVPAGTWHTARIGASARVLFMTPGEDTLNSEFPP